MSGVEQAAAIETRAGVNASARRLRILVVDDNKPFAETLSWVLQGNGDLVEIAHNGPAALEAAQRLDPDIVFLDIVLPVMDGYEICKRLRAQSTNPDLKIISQSGFEDAAAEAVKRDACFDVHLSKPIDLTQVVAVLNDTRWNRLKSHYPRRR